MIPPVRVDKRSPFLGEACALCKQPLAPGDEIVVCPEDGSRHHAHCWRANNNRCSAYGCMGNGPIETDSPRQRPPVIETTTTRGRRSKVRVLPSSSFGCAQSCLLISIAIAILLFAVGCFGLWAIADYILIEILDWPYRAPLTGSISPSDIVAVIRGLGNLSVWDLSAII